MTKPDSSNYPLGVWIKEKRGRGKALAAAVDCAESLISGTASGKSRPGTGVAIAISKVTGLSLDEILAPWMDHAGEDGAPGFAPQSQTKSENGAGA